MEKIIVVAGATGNLGGRIVKALSGKGVEVRALVRTGTDKQKTEELAQRGAKVILVDLLNTGEITEACKGASCVISALQGLHDVIVDTQKRMLDAAVAVGVPRFIPSDFSVDFTNLPAGENRNFDLRKEFHTYLDTVPIKATSIFNGAFDLFPPLLNAKEKTVGFWENADHEIYVTTMDDTAAFTAAVALDEDAPKALLIASFHLSANGLAAAAEAVFGAPFKTIRMGSLAELADNTKKLRAANPEGENQLYPRWQQMQYLQSMFSAAPPPFDNDRYPDLQWTPVQEVMTAAGKRG